MVTVVEKTPFQKIRENGISRIGRFRLPETLQVVSYAVANADRFIRRGIDVRYSTDIHFRVLEDSFHGMMTVSSVRAAIESDPTGIYEINAKGDPVKTAASYMNFVATKTVDGKAVAQFDTKRDIERVKMSLDFLTNNQGTLTDLRTSLDNVRNELSMVQETLKLPLTPERKNAVISALRTYRNQLTGRDGAGGTLSGIGDIFEVLNAPLEDLKADLKNHEQSLDDIQARPAQSSDERMVGGSVVARLAAHKARPEYEKIKAFHKSVSEKIETGKTEIEKDHQDIYKTLEEAIENLQADISIGALENVKVLDEKLKGLTDKLEMLSGSNFDALSAQAKEAQEARQKFTQAFIDSTEVPVVNGDFDTWGTQFRLNNPRGRVERKATKKDIEEYKALCEKFKKEYKDGHGHEIDRKNSDYPKLLQGFIEIDPKDPRVLPHADWRTTDNLYTSRKDNGPITDAQKFMEFSYAQNFSGEISRAKDPTAFDMAIGNVNSQVAEKIKELLTPKPGRTPDVNAVIEGLKWLAIQYVSDFEGANRNQGINPKMPDFLKEFFNKNPEGKIWNDYWDQLLQHMHVVNESGGANNIRSGWFVAWQITRNLRFGADFGNEIKSDKPGEYQGAREWLYGTGLNFKFLSPTLQAKGKPYYTFVYPILTPLKSVANIVGKNRIQGMAIRGMLNHKVASAIGLTALGVTAYLAGPAILVAGLTYAAAYQTPLVLGGGALAAWRGTALYNKLRFTDDQWKAELEKPKTIEDYERILKAHQDSAQKKFEAETQEFDLHLTQKVEKNLSSRLTASIKTEFTEAAKNNAPNPFAPKSFGLSETGSKPKEEKAEFEPYKEWTPEEIEEEVENEMNDLGMRFDFI